MRSLDSPLNPVATPPSVAPSSVPAGAILGCGGALFGTFGWLVAVVLLVVVLQSKGCTVPWPVAPSAKVDRVTYVWEKDDTGAVPSGVRAAFDKLNREGIVANDFEDDTVDGDGQVPDQYKVALEASKKTGVPVLVVQAGAKVVRAVKSPTLPEHVEKAVKP